MSALQSLFDEYQQTLGIVALSLASFTVSAQTATVTEIHSFSFNSSKGKGPVSGLIADASGALYGTTEEGGAYGAGTVFKLTPPASGSGKWKETVIYSFCPDLDNCIDGEYPTAGVIFGSDGALYGTTYKGGLNYYGAVFKLTPPADGHGAWTETVPYDFCALTSCADGSYPVGGLRFGSDGALYGTTSEGGDNDYGMVFKLVRGFTEQKWTEHPIWSFDAYDGDGRTPEAGLLFGADGALYGTTEYGGTGCSHIGGCGTVFEVLPPAPGHTQWKEAVLYSFQGEGDGAYPLAGLVADAAGALYGTTTYAGAYCNYTDACGTVFKILPTTGKLETLSSFGQPFSDPDINDGLLPVGRLIFGKDGALYGTTEYGGYFGNGNNSYFGACDFVETCGTIFTVKPPTPNGLQSWEEYPIYQFCYQDQFCSVGANPTAGLFLGPDGAFYGTTSFQGAGYACNCGTVFKLDYLDLRHRKRGSRH